MSSTRRSTCTYGKFTHRLICTGISGQRPQKESSPPDSYICQHMDLPTDYANKSRWPVVCWSQLILLARPNCAHSVSLPCSMTLCWYHESGHGGNLYHGNRQTGCKYGLLFWRADFSTHHCPGVPLRLCQW